MNISSQDIPLVSVIIPLYNKAPYIKRAINSVLIQTVQNFEIVVVNDGSTDNGDKIVTEFHDSRIILVHQQNQGVSAARNYGVEIAKSNLISFLDADDEWEPEFLEAVLKLRIRYPDAGLYTTGWHSCIRGKLIKRRYSGFKEGWEGIIPNIFRTISLSDGSTFPGNSSSTAVPKDVFLESGGFRRGCSAAEDIDLWARICLKYSNAHTQQYLSIYHHDDGYSLGKNIVAYLGKHPFELSLEELSELGILLPDDYSEDLKLYLDSININHANNWITAGDKKTALQYLLKVEHKELWRKVVITWIRLISPKFLFQYLIIIYRGIFR